MISDELARLSQLAEPWCSKQLIVDLWGLDLDERRVAAAFSAWAARFYKQPALRNAGMGLEVNRHILETFLLQNDLTSWKRAAVGLGMSEQQLRQTIDKLKTNGVYPQLSSDVSDQVVRAREAELLHRVFPSLQSKVFSSHTKTCRALHDAIGNELSIQIEPVFCVTSLILDAASPDLAAGLDSISLAPVGLRYQVWLETKKPANLAPDTCSLKLYAQNEEALKPWLMKGSKPVKIDKRLRVAA